MRLALIVLFVAATTATGYFLGQLAESNKPLSQEPGGGVIVGLLSLPCDEEHVPHGILDLELAWTESRARNIVESWMGREAESRWPGAAAAALEAADACPSRIAAASESLSLDRWLIPSYLVALTALFLLVGGAFAPLDRLPWRIASVLPALAAASDAAENYLLNELLADGAYALAPLVSLAATAKFLLLAATLIALLIVFFAWLGKRLNRPRTEKATPFSTVAAAESRYLVQRRKKAGVPERQPALGLALSGGGIRSATINLGILQALARRRVLPRFDYLSTVSGGGYIGSALSSLLSINGARIGVSPTGKKEQYHFAEYDDRQRDKAWFTTEQDRFPFNEQDTRGEDGVGRGFGGAAQMRHLRAAGSFLVGRQSLFSLEMLRAMGSVVGGILYHLLHFGLLLIALSAFYLWVTYQMVGIRATYQNPGQERYRDFVEHAFGLNLPWNLEHPFFAAWVTGFVATALTLLLAQQLLPRLPDGWFLRTGLTAGHSRNLVAVFAMLITMLVFGFGVLGPWFRFALPDELVNISIPLVSYLGGGACLGILHGWVKMSRRFRRTHRSRLAAQEGAFVVLSAVSLVLVLLILPFLVFFENVVDYLAERPFGSLIGWLLTLLGARLFAGGEQQQDDARGFVGRLLAKFPGLRKLVLSAAVFAAVVGGFLLICVGMWRLEQRYGLSVDDFADFRLSVCAIALALFLLTGLFNFNRLALHYFYRDRLVEAYLRTAASDANSRRALELLRDNEDLRLRGPARQAAARTAATRRAGGLRDLVPLPSGGHLSQPVGGRAPPPGHPQDRPVHLLASVLRLGDDRLREVLNLPRRRYAAGRGDDHLRRGGEPGHGPAVLLRPVGGDDPVQRTPGAMGRESGLRRRHQAPAHLVLAALPVQRAPRLLRRQRASRLSDGRRPQR